MQDPSHKAMDTSDREVFQRKVDKIFDFLDKDKDGVLATEELKKGIK